MLQAPTVGLAPWSPALDENIGRAALYVPSDYGMPATGVIAESAELCPARSHWLFALMAVVVGQAENASGQYRAFLYRGRTLLDVDAWLASVGGNSRIYNDGTTLAGLPLEGAHHRPMMSFDRMGKESQAWATGDFGSSSRTRDVHVTTGEAGINWNVGKTGLIGFAAGHLAETAGDRCAWAKFDSKPGAARQFLHQINRSADRTIRALEFVKAREMVQTPVQHRFVICCLHSR